MTSINDSVKERFLKGLADILDTDVTKLTEHSALANYAWDSMAIISTIALADNLYNKTLGGQALANCEKVGDVIALVDRQ